MENIFKISKRSIISILTFCILLGIAGNCLNVTAMAAETTASLEETAVATEETTTVTEENTQELVPAMARGCGYGNLTSWSNIDHDTKRSILADVPGNYQAVVGNNPNIYYDSSGVIYLCGTGPYSGRTYPTDLNKSWY